MKKPRDGPREGKEGGNLSGRKTHAQSGARALRTLGQTGEGWWEPRRLRAHRAPVIPAPPAGWRRGGAEGRARPAHALEPQDAPALQRRWSPAEGGPPLLTAPHRAEATGFHLRGAGSGSHLQEASP